MTATSSRRLFSPRCLAAGIHSAWFWVAIAGICLALEAGALYYQHVLGDMPCEICIYIRVWLLAILVLVLVGLAVNRRRWLSTLVSLGGLGLSIGLASETWNMVKVEYNLGDGGSCSFNANFPEWAPLDSWLPALFEVQGLCMRTPEVLFGLTMTHGLIGVSALFILAFAARFGLDLSRKRVR